MLQTGFQLSGDPRALKGSYLDLQSAQNDVQFPQKETAWAIEGRDFGYLEVQECSYRITHLEPHQNDFGTCLGMHIHPRAESFDSKLSQNRTNHKHIPRRSGETPRPVLRGQRGGVLDFPE